jgi:hypothetical protein
VRLPQSVIPPVRAHRDCWGGRCGERQRGKRSESEEPDDGRNLGTHAISLAATHG